MKAVISIFVIFLLFSLSACSSLKSDKEFFIKYEGERVTKDYTKEYVYSYWFDENNVEDICAYIDRNNSQYVITVGSPNGNMRNEFIYEYSTDSRLNFHNAFMNQGLRVNSLRQALDYAVTLYLENNL